MENTQTETNQLEENRAEATQPEKKKKYFADQFIVLIILTFLLLMIGSILQSCITATESTFADRFPDLVPVVDYASTIGLWAVFLLFMAIYKPDRPLIKSLFAGKTNTLKYLLIGLAAGFLANASCILVSVLRQDIALHFEPSSILFLILGFFAVMIQSGSEELICRHFMQQHLRRRYHKPWLEILLPGISFAALHLFNPGVGALPVINLVLCGILLGTAIYYFDSMWLVIGFHTMWNFTQNLLFGLPNSGIVTPLTVFRLDAASARDSFSYNVAFGVEGSPMAVLVQLIALFLVIFFGKKRRSPGR